MATRTVEIPAAKKIDASAREFAVRIILTDANGDALIGFATGDDDIVGGEITVQAADSDQTVPLITQDSIAPTSYYKVQVSGRGVFQEYSGLQVPSGTGTLDWETFTEVGSPVDAANIWTGRIIPSGGATGQIIKKDSAVDYDVSWQNESGGGGGGDVTKVGTPVDGQVGIWTGDGTIEGDVALSFDTTTDTLAIGASGNLAFGAVVVLADSAGTATLQNIDAIDATTEATLEAAIDHDDLAGFVANEHIDWTGDAGADNIHVNNITAVPESAVTAHEAAINALSLTNAPAEANADVTDATNVAAAGAHMSGGTDVPITDGGTGQSTAQAAIDALTQISGATNEYVLTKDTGTGSATWKAAAGGWDGDIADIDLDGGTDIGSNLADADLILVDDGGAGTNRAAAVTRIRDYVRLDQSSQSPTTGDITGAVNTHYLVNISGLTAIRNLTLPTATAGDRIRVTITASDDEYELVIKGAATVTINEGSTATEWSRLFIDYETVEFEATSSTNWAVVEDGRIASAVKMYSDDNNIQTLTYNTGNIITLNAAASDNGDLADTTNKWIKIRRTGNYLYSLNMRFTKNSGGSVNDPQDMDWFSVVLYYDSAGSTPDTSISLPFLMENVGGTYINLSQTNMLTAGWSATLRVYPYRSAGTENLYTIGVSGDNSNNPAVVMIEQLGR